MHANYARFLTFLLCMLTILSAAVYAELLPRIVLESNAFPNGAKIPALYTCSGPDDSPPLKWTGLPPGAMTLAIIVTDPDAPGGDFVHWLIYDLPASFSRLPTNLPKSPTLAQGAAQGITSFGRSGYWGPCPPPGPPHRYHFVIYAVDRKLRLKAGANAIEVERALKGHVLGKGELVGIFGRGGPGSAP